jgi:hypothetical protein
MSKEIMMGGNDHKKCLICGKSNTHIMAHQVTRPDNQFYNYADRKGFIFFHLKCMMEYKKKMEDMA